MGGLRKVVWHVSKEKAHKEAGVTPNVWDANCLECHSQVHEEVVYHSLRMTHEKHLARGYACTTCHFNLVHGGASPWKNTPSMATCFNPRGAGGCHNGKDAPNDCTLCHLRLGEVNPPLFNPDWVTAHKHNIQDTGLARCQTCHQSDFCVSCHRTAQPHGEAWLSRHRQAAVQPGAKCSTCHQQSQCDECHKVRRAHAVNWVMEHPQEVKEEQLLHPNRPSACWQCHDQKFCGNCHAKYTPHGAGWIQQHPKEAKANLTSCNTCHKSYFCLGCHLDKKPESHDERWKDLHGYEAAAGGSTCSLCHETEFCRTCHEKNRPASHRNVAVWRETHGGLVRAGNQSCQACHKESECNRCHALPMPHPKDWAKTHPARAKTNSQVCSKCHEKIFCTSCHGGTKPASHTADWKKRHGNAAISKTENCALCHRDESLCKSCHKLDMPHPSGWTASGHQASAKQDMGTCFTCHDRDECLKCHMASKPPATHTAGWRKSHVGPAQKDAASCQICHGENACMDCHKVQMPHSPRWTASGHEGKASWAKDSVCLNCHTTKYCSQCHTVH